MPTRRAWYAAAALVAATLGGCALVAGLYTPLPAHCADGLQNEDETGVDCGGECAKCDGVACERNDQCQSLWCPDGKCQRPACLPGSKKEEDSCHACHRCAVDEPCASPSDCLSGYCAGGTCAQCNVDGDCAAAPCLGNVCVAVTCHNGVQDPSETGVDCGGSCAQAFGTACLDAGAGGAGGMGTGGSGGAGGMGGGDGGLPACANDIKDGTESDVDCGGTVCGRCTVGKDCNDHPDCESGNCENGKCGISKCTDGSKNGTETGVDCGGLCPARCQAGQGCNFKFDCEVGLECVAEVCVAP